MFRKRSKPPPGLVIGGRLFPWSTCCQGLFICGEPGSGKSHFMQSLIRQLVGRVPIVISTVKPTDYGDVERICRETGHHDRLVRLGRGSPHKLDIGECFTDPRMLPGASVRHLSHTLEMAGEMLNNTKGGGNSDQFFSTAIAEGTVVAAQICKLATGRVNLAEMLDVINSFPVSAEEFASDAFYSNRACGRMLARARDTRRPEAEYVFRQSVDYVDRISTIGDKARSAIVQGAASVLGGLVAEFQAEICTGSNVSPASVEAGRICLVVDGAPMLNRAAGRVFNFLTVAAFQFFCMARHPGELEVPTFLFRDEAAWSLSSQLDAQVQAVSRGQLLASVSAVQNLPILTAGLGGNDRARMEAQAFASMHKCKFFHRNSCPETGEYASKIIGEEMRVIVGGSSGEGKGADLVSQALGCNSNYNWHQQSMPLVRPEAFGRLNVGECVLVTRGRHQYLDLYEGRRR